jgi:hypothetical protein
MKPKVLVLHATGSNRFHKAALGCELETCRIGLTRTFLTGPLTAEKRVQ